MTKISFVKVEAVIDFSTLATILVAEDRSNKQLLNDIRALDKEGEFLEYCYNELSEPMDIYGIQECLEEFIELQLDS